MDSARVLIKEQANVLMREKIEMSKPIQLSKSEDIWLYFESEESKYEL